MDLIADIVDIYSNYPAIHTEVLVASIRNPMHVVEAGKLGADVVTLPPAVLKQMYNHPLTDKGLAAFVADWAKTGQKILDQ
jgi:transaldolase